LLRFRKFERRKFMEEDRETRTDEDVEAHMTKGAVTKGRNDEGDDVEAHMTKGAVTKGAVTKGRNDEGDDDDVEAHMLKNAVTKGMTKA
jgi:hypothetical protein